MAKKREQLNLEEEHFAELRIEGTLFDDKTEEELFVVVEDKVTYHDSEKSSVDHEIVIRRVSDNKFFKGSYTKWGQGNVEYETSFREVFPKKITRTIYE